MLDLEKYLLDRELQEPDRDLDREILETPDLLAKAHTAWDHGKDGIRLVVRARLLKLRQELIFSALPVEVPVLRQAIAELAALLEDFERYSVAHERGIEAASKEEKQPE